MNVLAQTLWLDIAHRVGWTLIHSLWQLAAVAVLVMIALRLLQRAKPQTRYVVAGSGLLLMACLPIISFVYVATAPDGVALDSELIEHGEAVADRNDTSSDNANELRNDTVVSKATAEQHVARNHANFVTDSSSSLFESAEVVPTETSTVDASLHLTGNNTGWPAYFVTLIPWLTSVWLAGVCVFAAVHARGLFVVHRISRVGTIESEQHLQHRMEALADRLGIRVAIRMLETARVNTPLVIGWFRPVILVPLGMVTGLPAVQLDAVLLHELAHIRRHDYLVNAMQVLIETLLFYHPAVWWLSRRIRTEREYCCDDIAAAGCGSNLDLAKALAALETARFDTPLALAASGTGKEKATMKRVRRLLEGSSSAAASSGPLAAVLALLLFASGAACFAMVDDDKQGKNSQPANQQDNRQEQNNARDQTERARREDNKPSGDSVARIDNGLGKDLVVYYSFDDDTNGKVYDESGNENHGVTVGDVKYEPSFLGRAAGFTSNRTYIQSGTPGLNMHGWKQVSVSMWIKTKRYTTYGRLISRGEVSGDQLSGIAMQVGSSSSKASFSIGRQFQNNPPVWEKLYTSSLEPEKMDRIGKWVHLVGVFDGERLRLYVNGKLDREVETSSHRLKLWDRPGHKLVIGNSSMKSRMAWSDKYFDGLVDEVKIWRRSLSIEEIEHVYRQGRQSISSRRFRKLSQHARRLLPETEIGVGQQTTGLDLSDVSRDSGQQRDVDAFADNHRFFLRDVERLVKSKNSGILETVLNGSFPELKKPDQVGVTSIDEKRQMVKLNAGKRDGVRKDDRYDVSFRYEKPRFKAYYPREFAQVRRTLKVTEVHETSSMASVIRRPLSTMEWPQPDTTVGLSGLLGRVAVKQGVAIDIEAIEVPKVIDLGKDAIRFEGHDADEVKPGLVAVGWYPVKTLPTAKQVLLRHRSGEIPAGHAELVGRLPTMLPGFNGTGGSRLVFQRFTRKGSNIVANVYYVRPQAAERLKPKAVYLRAKLPDDLPSGKYHVTIRFTDSIDKGTGLLTVLDSLPTIPAMTCEFDVPGKSPDRIDASTDIPKHLRHWPGLSDRVAGEIANAPEDDVRVAKGYAKFADKGKVHNGRRVTIMTAKRKYALGEEVRVIHVLEAVKPGSRVYVMGPKAVYGECIDGHCVTDDPPEAVRYDGRVLDSPTVDYNYVITKYNFKDLGEHTIQWKAAGPFDGKGLESNVLRITVGADATAGESEDEKQDDELDSAPRRLNRAERDILQNYHASSAMVERAARICLRHQLTKAEVLKNVSNTMRSEAKKDSVTFFFAPSQLWTLTFDDDGKALSADITGKKLARADIEKSEPLQQRIDSVKIGMSRAAVERLLPPHADSPRLTVVQGGAQTTSYWLDASWKVTIAYDYTGVPRDESGKALARESSENKVITIPTLSREDMPQPIDPKSIEGPESVDPGPPAPGASTKANHVIINAQKTLTDVVGDGFPDETWAYPTGLLPNKFPELTYVSGPTDKSLSPKGAWRKPVVLKHENSDVLVHVNCYRRREKPAQQDAKVPGTPFLPLREPDYQYKQFEFHELPAATATAEDRQVIVFRRGDVLFKVETTSGKADARKKLAVAAAETIWHSLSQ